MLTSRDRAHLLLRLRAARVRALRFLDAPVASGTDDDPTELAISLLGEIDEALWRLEHAPDEFGRCARCGHRIHRERLELLPWARHCRHDAA